MSRFFFAVWPDAEGAGALAALAAQLAAQAGAKPMPQEKIHLTLAFLGTLDAAARSAAIAAANDSRGVAFRLAVDRTGSFPHARVAWAGFSHRPPGLLSLQSALDAALRSRGVELEQRPYVPHLTLARNVWRAVAESAVEPIAWRVDAFTLVRSDTGTGRYVVEERWGLAG